MIWYNWDKLGPRFAQLWADLKDSFGQFGTWLKGVATQWLAPFDALIKSLGERIETLRRMLGGGPTEDPHASRNGRRDRDDSVDFDGKPSLGGVPELRQNLDDEAKKWSMGYHPSGGGGQNGARVGFDPIEIKVTVDGNAKVEAPQRLQALDRGPMLRRV